MNISPAFSTTAVEIVARGMNLLVFLIIGNQFGAGTTTDTVFFLYAPLTVIMSVVAGTAQTVIMPGIHRAQVAHCANAFLRIIMKYAISVSLPVSLIAILVSWALSSHADFLIIVLLLPIPLLASLSAIYASLLNSEDKYQFAVLGPAYGSIISFLMILLMPVTVVGLAAILLSFEVGRAAGLRFHVYRRAGMMGKADENNANSVVRWTLRGARYQAIASLLAALSPLVDILFAKGFGTGAISSVEYASRLWNMVPFLFSGTLAVAYSSWSRIAASSKLDIYSVHVRAARFGGIALVFSVLIMLCSDLLIDILYGWGNIDAVNRQSLSTLLKLYLTGTAPFIAGMVYVRALSAQGRIPLVTMAASISVGANLILDWILVNICGLAGIGLATSITYVIVAAFLASRFGKSSPAPDSAPTPAYKPFYFKEVQP